MKFSVAGAYDLELSASDGDKTSAARIRVNVVEPGKPLVITERAPDPYIDAMKQIQAAQTSLRSQIGSRNYDGAAATIAVLKQSFDTAQSYWSGKSIADARTGERRREGGEQSRIPRCARRTTRACSPPRPL